LLQLRYKLAAAYSAKDQFDLLELLPEGLKNRRKPISKYGFWRSDQESTGGALSVPGDGAGFLKEA
jgi:hypothetical protein